MKKLFILFIIICISIFNSYAFIENTNLTYVGDSQNDIMIGMQFNVTIPFIFKNVTFANGYTGSFAYLYTCNGDLIKGNVAINSLTADFTSENIKLNTTNCLRIAGYKNAAYDARIKTACPTPIIGQYLNWSGSVYAAGLNFPNIKDLLTCRSIQSIGLDAIAPITNNSLAVRLDKNTTTLDSLWFNLSCFGNCSSIPQPYYEIFVNGILNQNSTDNFFTKTGLSNNTLYQIHVNISAIGLINWTDFNLTTLQTNQTVNNTLFEEQLTELRILNGAIKMIAISIFMTILLISSIIIILFVPDAKKTIGMILLWIWFIILPSTLATTDFINDDLLILDAKIMSNFAVICIPIMIGIYILILLFKPKDKEKDMYDIYNK